MASGSAPPVDHHREPCPDRILDDIGGAFSMGAIGGGLFHAGKQLIWGPKSFKMQSALEVRLDTSACLARLPCKGASRAIGKLCRGFEKIIACYCTNIRFHSAYHERGEGAALRTL
jgi:hypothetical protein